MTDRVVSNKLVVFLLLFFGPKGLNPVHILTFY
jgi:hypothetical protein